MTKSVMEVDNSNKTNLIVNYLPSDITLNKFVKLFESMGKIDSFRLVKDKDTGENLGYGFINYLNKEDAEQAVKTLNGTQISNKTIRVAYARPNAPKSINLFVSGLPGTMRLPELERMFTPYGRIITTRLLLDDNKTLDNNIQKVNALGFVRFEEKSDAEEAIKKLNGTIPQGGTEPILVMFPTENAKRLNASFAEFIKGNTKSDEAPPRKIKKRSVLQNRSKSDDELKSMGGIGMGMSPQIGHKLLTPQIQNPFTVSPAGNIGYPVENVPNSNQGATIYIFGLGDDSSDNTLWELFGPFGSVQSVKVIRDLNTNKCKGFGFVTMSNYGQALDAIRYLDGRLLNGNRRLQVSFKTEKNSN